MCVGEFTVLRLSKEKVEETRVLRAGGALNIGKMTQKDWCGFSLFPFLSGGLPELPLPGSSQSQDVVSVWAHSRVCVFVCVPRDLGCESLDLFSKL